MWRMAWLAVAVVVLAVAAKLLWDDSSRTQGTTEGVAHGEARHVPPAHTQPVLRSGGTSARPTPARAPASAPGLTQDQLWARADWDLALARGEHLVAAGLLSPDAADAERLDALFGRRSSGEISELEFYQARAEIHARRVARREVAHAAGHCEESDLRDARLDLAEAVAEATGDVAPHAAAWREHFDWIVARVEKRVAADPARESHYRAVIDTFLRGTAWPRGLADEVVRMSAPYATGRWGWVQSVDDAAATPSHVHLRFGGATHLKVGLERRICRGDLQIAEVRIIGVEQDGSVVTAEITSCTPGSAPRPGDRVTTD